MGRSRRARVLAVHLLALVSLATLFGCGSKEESAFELDFIRPPRAGEKCDMTWRGPAVDEAAAASVFLNRAVVRPGGELWAAIENKGFGDLETGIEPKVKRRVGDDWVEQFFPGTEFSLRAETIELRTVSLCMGVPIPKTWKPGLYRVAFEVSPHGSVERIEGAGFPAYFWVR
jgi:hypothetical protein